MLHTPKLTNEQLLAMCAKIVQYIHGLSWTVGQYFRTVQDRLRLKLKLTPKITAVLTEQGMTKAYLHTFHLREDATCSCGNEYQTIDHILFHCETPESNETP